MTKPKNIIVQQSSNNNNLVRPRTIMQENTQKTSKLKRNRSFVTLSLCGACLFLLILCGCLITSLVLVGKSLSKSDKPADVIASLSDNILNTANANDKTVQTVQTTLKNTRCTNTPWEYKATNLSTESGLDEFSLITMMNVPKMSKIIDQLSWRLPKEIKPILYELTLKPDLKTKTFSGNILIHVAVIKPISYIAVHAHTLTITKTLLEKKNSTNDERPNNVTIAHAFAYPKFQYWVTEVENPLPTGDYVLGLSFNGSLENRIVGFYQSTYKNPATNESRSIATSKFEPTYARQAFPCFDEPAMKAKFKISLQIPTGDEYHALSNMPNETTVENGDGTKTVQFQESVRMSSYLACFIVSDFAYKADEVVPNLTMRVFATPGQLNKVDFALETGLRITRFYIEYFNVAYPLPKLDMAAIPDFVSGAMEHWGLVTFRETALLYEEGVSSTANKQRVATVIAHEVAHMWFGNLVTMAWWDELWLNEGFASYIEYKGTNAAYADWKMMDQFLIDDLHSVLTLDATLASHPIVQTVSTPDQITEIFDTITYNKGAAVIRMMDHFIGEDNFKKSVTSYLQKHAYDNAVTNDLLDEIDSLGLGIDVKHIMGTWTKQMGFPVVNVTKVNETQYLLTQTRFFSNPENAGHEYTDSEYNYRWFIPITYETNAEEPKLEWFSNEDNQLIINVETDHRWIKFNKDQVGYYRVNYPQEMWASLSNELLTNFTSFSISDRGHLLNDAFSLAEATHLSYDIALELTSYLINEDEYVPWSVASTNLLNLKNQLYHTPQFSKFSKFGQSVIEKIYNEVGWNVDENHLKNQLRTTVLSYACSIGLSDCIAEAGNKFNAWLENPDDRPDPDLRNVVYYYGMASVGNEQKWDQVWEIYKKETDASEKAKLVYGLSGIQIPWMLSRFVDYAWDRNNVRDQDYFTCMQNIAANRVGESIVWGYVRDNWENLVARFGLNERYLGRMIPSICGRFNTKTSLEEVNAFFTKYPDAGAGAAARQQTIQDIQNRIQWLENNQQKVADWLNANVAI